MKDDFGRMRCDICGKHTQFRRERPDCCITCQEKFETDVDFVNAVQNGEIELYRDKVKKEGTNDRSG